MWKLIRWNKSLSQRYKDEHCMSLPLNDVIMEHIKMGFDGIPLNFTKTDKRSLRASVVEYGKGSNLAHYSVPQVWDICQYEMFSSVVTLKRWHSFSQENFSSFLFLFYCPLKSVGWNRTFLKFTLMLHR